MTLLFTAASQLPGRSQPSANDTTVETNLHLIAKSYGDSIVLRWAPSTAGAWWMGNEYGYDIERLGVVPGGHFDPELFVKINSQPLKPFSLEKFRTLADANPNNEYLLAAAECIYGEMESTALGEGLANWAARSQELSNRWGMAIFAADMDAMAAKAAGLRFSDKNVAPGKVYFYRLVPLVPADKYEMNVAYVSISANEKTAVPRPVIDGVSEEEGAVYLQWDRAFHENNFTGYFIERSGDGVRFSRLNELPYVQGQTGDSLLHSPYFSYKDAVENYQPHYYRLRGITPFGETSPPSDPMNAMARDRTPPPAPVNVEATHLGGPDMRIRWQPGGPSPDLEGWRILKALSIRGPFKPLHLSTLPATLSSYIDKNANAFGTSYYRVEAVDTAGNAATSIVAFGTVYDSLPPSMPVGLNGSIDTNGVVTLRWSLGPEWDILGYKVFVASHANHDFALLTSRPIADTVFQDTIHLKSLSKKIYYRIVAVDGHSNHSPFSEILELTKPDQVPPAPPLFTAYRVEDDHVFLQWVCSSSDDVARHILYRREPGGEWREHTSFTDDTDSFMDRQIENRTTYDYEIRAEDEAGLLSDAVNPLRLTALSLALKPPVSSFIFQKTNDSEILLQWSYPYLAGQRYVVYKSVNGGPFLSTKTLAPQEKSWRDGRVKAGESYEYAVKVVFENGEQSRFSEVLKVQL